MRGTCPTVSLSSSHILNFLALFFPIFSLGSVESTAFINRNRHYATGPVTVYVCARACVCVCVRVRVCVCACVCVCV